MYAIHSHIFTYRRHSSDPRIQKRTHNGSLPTRLLCTETRAGTDYLRMRSQWKCSLLSIPLHNTKSTVYRSPCFNTTIIIHSKNRHCIASDKLMYFIFWSFHHGTSFMILIFKKVCLPHIMLASHKWEVLKKKKKKKHSLHVIINIYFQFIELLFTK